MKIVHEYTKNLVQKTNDHQRLTAWFRTSRKSSLRSYIANCDVLGLTSLTENFTNFLVLAIWI